MVKKIIKNKNIPSLKPSVACIGYFDGVHKGHQKLIEKTIKEAKKSNLIPCLICFEPDPLNVINKEKNDHILCYKDRLNLIESFGIEQIIIIKFDLDLMKIKPLSFINNYLNKMNIKKLIYGYDFSFGYKGLGNSSLLIKKGNFESIVINEYKYLNKKVSSTRIKQAIIDGNFKLANRLLGYEYAIVMKVINCSKQKNKWLIEAKPHSNLVLPKDGEYGNGFEVKNKRIYILGPSRLKKDQLLITSFSKDE